MIFSKTIKKNHEFRKVYQCGKSCANKYLVMYVMDNNSDKNYIGISVSKKVGNSVKRHRITRLIRESYRQCESIFNSGLNMVIVVKVNAAEITFKETKSALLHLGRLHKIINNEKYNTLYN